MNLNLWKPGTFPFWHNRGNRHLSTFQKEMSDLMDNFIGQGYSVTPQLYGMNFFPAVVIKEKEDKYLLEAELPGMGEDDLNIDFHNNILTIKGEKKTEFKEKEEGIIRFERSYGSFRRDIPFEETIEAEKIKAEMKKGMLYIELMKKEKGAASHKKIEIKK